MSRFFLSLLLIFFSTWSVAQITVGLGVGQASYDWNGLDFDRGNAFELKSGYLFSQHFALELAYRDLGDAQGALFDIRTKGLDFALRAQLPLRDRINLYGKLGYMDYETELRAESAIFTVGSYSGVGAPVIQQVDLLSEKGEDLTASFGFDFQVNRVASVYLEYCYFNFDQNLSSVMAGVSYSL